MQPNLIIILGPTASGKTKLATGIAAAIKTEIISADSRQVYRGMDIGTGKDLNEYSVNGYDIPYHLIDIVPAGERYHIDRFKKDFFDVFEQIIAKGKIPVLCGGTGLYIDALLGNFEYTAVPVNTQLRAQLVDLPKTELERLFSQLPDHPYKQKVDTSTAKRLIRGIEIVTYLNEHSFVPDEKPAIEPVIIGTAVSVEIRRKNIEKRLLQRLQNGLIEEVQELRKVLSDEQLIYYGLEYKFITQYLAGELNYETMSERLLVAIQQYAKRQMTYFRKMEKDGKKIFWMDTNAGVTKHTIDTALAHLSLK